MPKRKALGPVENSDGEEEEYYSFPSTPIQSPFPKMSQKTFYAPPKRIGSSTPLAAFSFGGNDANNTPSLASKSGSPPKFQEILLSNSHFVKGGGGAAFAAKKPRATEFAKSLRVLNAAFINSCQSAISKNPSHSLLPLVKDYLHHSRVLMEECKEHNGGNGKPTELVVNGINPAKPVNKSFKALGEFFEEFEQNFVESNKSRATDKKCEGTTSNVVLKSALTNSTSSSVVGNFAVGATGKLDNSFSFGISPSKSSTIDPKSASNINNNVISSNSSGSSPLKASPLVSSSSSLTKTPVVDFSKVNNTPFSSSSYLANSSKPPTSISSTPPPIVVSKPPEVVTSEKPAAPAPFAGFSFFTVPPPNPNAFASSSSGATSTAPAAASAPEKKSNEDEDGDEDEEPPKNVVTLVTEEDAVYSTRCKVFGMIDGKYKDKGVGMLYIKKLDSDKYQVVVRADNNLGTVILNILLQNSLPLEKKSGKDVMTVDLQGNNKKGMPILLRTKSENDATDLLNNLKKYQQSNSS